MKIFFKILLRSLLLIAITAGFYFVLNCQYFWRLFFIPNIPAGVVTGERESNTLFIPSLSIRVPVIFAEIEDEAKFQEALARGAVHYPGTANIGGAGNCYIFGHSSDYFWSKGKYKNIFAVLPKIKEGETIIASDGSGQRHIYRVTQKLVVPASDLSQLLPSRNGISELTLQTSYPLGTAWKRYIVRAEKTE